MKSLPVCGPAEAVSPCCCIKTIVEVSRNARTHLVGPPFFASAHNAICAEEVLHRGCDFHNVRL